MVYWVKGSIIFAILIATNYFLVKYFVRRKMRSIAKQVMLSDLRAIRAQMNPHFIFNSLNSINRYILRNEPEIASDYLERFARLMRMVLDNSNHERVLLSEEIKAINLYLELEQLRFDHQFTFEINIDEAIDQEQVLVQPLLFQPFLENAIWHGLLHKEDNNKELNLTIKLDGPNLVCNIRDNGVGRDYFKANPPEKRKSYGIKLAKDRLQFLDKNSSIIIEDIKDINGQSLGTNAKLTFKKIENYTF